MLLCSLRTRPHEVLFCATGSHASFQVYSKQSCCLDTQGQQILYDKLDISIIVDREKARWLLDFLLDTDHSSLQLCRTVCTADHSVYQYSDYLSTVRCYPHRRLISRSRCGCHGIHVDTGRFGKDSEHRSREDRVCFVCMSGSVEDEHYFLFDCPACSHIRQQYSHLFHQASPSLAALFWVLTNSMWYAVVSRLVSHKDNMLWSTFSVASELCRIRLV